MKQIIQANSNVYAICNTKLFFGASEKQLICRELQELLQLYHHSPYTTVPLNSQGLYHFWLIYKFLCNNIASFIIWRSRINATWKKEKQLSNTFMLIHIIILREQPQEPRLQTREGKVFGYFSLKRSLYRELEHKIMNQIFS